MIDGPTLGADREPANPFYLGEITRALQALGCTGPATAADVLDAAPVPLSEPERRAVLQRFGPAPADAAPGDPGE